MAYLLRWWPDSWTARLTACWIWRTGRKQLSCWYQLDSFPRASIGSSSDLEPLSLDTQPISEYEVELPAIWEMHGASSLTDEAEVVSWRGEGPAMLMPHPSGRLVPLNRYSDGETPQDSIESVIVRRGSARRFSHESITLRELSTVLEEATQGIPADFLGQPGAALNDIYLIVNTVDDLPSGAYVFHRDLKALELLKEGDYRRQAGHLGLGSAASGRCQRRLFLHD